MLVNLHPKRNCEIVGSDGKLFCMLELTRLWKYVVTQSLLKSVIRIYETFENSLGINNIFAKNL